MECLQHLNRRNVAAGSLALLLSTLEPQSAHAYRTVQQAMEDTQQVSKQSELYARFAVVRERMGQTDEFGKLADEEKWDNLQALARNYNRVVQQDEMLRIVDMLSGSTKDDAKKYSELVKNDLKAVDSAARKKDAGKVKEATGKLEENMKAFLVLQPSDLREQFGVPDL